MSGAAVGFFIKAKKLEAALGSTWLEVKDGFVLAKGFQIVPVYKIPKDEKKWPRLANVLLKMVVNLSVQGSNKDWIDKFSGTVSAVDANLLDEWDKVIGLKPSQSVPPKSPSPSMPPPVEPPLSFLPPHFVVPSLVLDGMKSPVPPKKIVSQIGTKQSGMKPNNPGSVT